MARSCIIDLLSNGPGEDPDADAIVSGADDANPAAPAASGCTPADGSAPVTNPPCGCDGQQCESGFACNSAGTVKCLQTCEIFFQNLGYQPDPSNRFYLCLTYFIACLSTSSN